MISDRVLYSPSDVFTVNGVSETVDLGDVVLDDFGAELLRLRPHLGHEFRTHDAVAMARPVLDERGHHELTAGFEPLDDQRLQVRAR